jgi:CO dehydrogenase/acetyl-CoA synthase delta subunit
LLCQSFAPNHVCVITPERLGLCGAYNWLDGKAAYEIDETGPNQPLKKGECLDPVKGIWSGVNEYVYTNSHKAIDAFCAYSIMDRPMTSCGCFEAICAYVPECNGVMIVNREYLGETPIGMTFSTLAGEVGGGHQTPGFFGCGKVFLTSRKFLSAEGGFGRIVWMPKELKDLLRNDLVKRFDEKGLSGFIDKIADETVAVTAEDLRAHMEKIKHPALSMEDMASFAQSEQNEAPAKTDAVPEKAAAAPPSAGPITQTGAALANVDIAAITEQVKASVTKEIITSIIDILSEKFLGQAPVLKTGPKTEVPKAKAGPLASERIAAIKSFALPIESSSGTTYTVTLRNRKSVGGANCMPFHFWEGKMPNRPLVAMEVFDSVGEKYPPILRETFKDVLNSPAEMAKVCVNQYGADLISVKLEGIHPERDNRSAAQSIEFVKSILAAVDVPLIISGISHFEKNNEVMKAIAQACEGENLLFNWVEQDNYRTIAGAAMAYGHTLVAQAPIDVNISKQLNILLTNMGLSPDKIIIDPMTSTIGYGVEYTYSVMERIRLTGLGGDNMLLSPMIVSVGQECAKIKEFKASEASFPDWGDLEKRAAYWEAATATTLLYAGADILILSVPEAVKTLKRIIASLMESGGN